MAASWESLRSHRVRGKDPKTMAQDMMSYVLRELMKKDVYDFFGLPVDTAAVPDYLDKIATPMDFSTIQKKINRHEYTSFDAFKLDVVIVFNNAQNYNLETTAYYREAVKLETAAYALFVEAEDRLTAHQAAYNRAGAFALKTPSPKRQRMGSPAKDHRPPLPDVRSPDDANTPQFNLLPAFLNIHPEPPKTPSPAKPPQSTDTKFFHDMTLEDIECGEACFIFDDIIHAPPTRTNDGLFIYDEESANQAFAAPSEDDVFPNNPTGAMVASQDAAPSCSPQHPSTVSAQSIECDTLVHTAPVPTVRRANSPPQKENLEPSIGSKTNNGWLQSKRNATQLPKSQSLWSSTAVVKAPPRQHDPNDIFGINAKKKRQPRQVLLDKFVQPSQPFN
ncbi:hypothetical protein ACHHYP_01485 [Achlya hypogyna]|uniref:Bromo domain-containing protein n=1 Tax=Achlya hypogyna TaxID=1202772 RepID=A0A1V9ZTC4_ACHHY|nr:hypothetical protein ACHHYP_01485 [Achlya hypogyna]